jgi:hypothetical protein
LGRPWRRRALKDLAEIVEGRGNVMGGDGDDDDEAERREDDERMKVRAGLTTSTKDEVWRQRKAAKKRKRGRRFMASPW